MAHDLKILHAADLHGNLSHYRRLLFLAEKEKADCIVIGGDLLPGGLPLAVLAEAQRRFIINCLRPLFEKFKEVNLEKTIYLMMGNDDFAINMDRLEEMECDGLVKSLHLRTHPLTDSLSIAGYGCVPPTSFLIKDWERLDGERAAVPARSYQACSSAPDGIVPVDVREWFITHNTIGEDLETLARLSEPASTVYVMHTPPFGTTLDVLRNGRHAGSRLVRRFIEEYMPPLTLHGHIHESHHMTMELTDRIGRTVCINPGQSEKVLHAVIINLSGQNLSRISSMTAKIP
ncbi:MAG: metallophosphoesterase [Syntrophorhabdaceae bacterium]|nr:metallophosphoesterase [Syntrophorhabdaceae bacterium]